MLKYTSIIALLCAIMTYALEKGNLSREIIITIPKSTTIAFHNQLYTVSTSKSNVHVNSSDANYQPCDMTIDPTKDSIDGEMKIITSDKTIYIIGEHSVERIDGKDRTKYALLMIDPRSCKLKSADINKDINIGMSINVKTSLPRLLTNNIGGVDVYFPSMQTCAPCRFDNEGVKVKDQPKQITSPETHSDGRIFSFHIRKVGANYLYAQNAKGKRATLRSLDGENMSVVKEKEVDYNVDAMANTKTGLAGVCSKTHDPMVMDVVAFKEINCEQIDANLESKAKFRIAIEPHSLPLSSISYEIDEQSGKTYIGFIQDQELRVYVYDTVNGELLKSYDLGNINDKSAKYRRPMFYVPYTSWNLRGFIAGKEYCLVTEQLNGRKKNEVYAHAVRCIAI